MTSATLEAGRRQLTRLEERRMFARASRNDMTARGALIEHFMPLARRLAWRYARSRDAREDLTQVAYLGLVKAIDRYDPGRGVPFESYALPTIVGELKRSFRDTGWAVRLPRTLQERCVALDRERGRLAERLGRTPTPSELASALDVDVEQVLETLEASLQMHAESLDQPLADGAEDTSSRHDVLGREEPGFERVEDQLTIAPEVAALSERERTVLRLRFVDDLTQSEIGERLGVSQMHVSRMLSRTLARVRARALAAPEHA